MTLKPLKKTDIGRQPGEGCAKLSCRAGSIWPNRKPVPVVAAGAIHSPVPAISLKSGHILPRYAWEANPDRHGLTISGAKATLS
jgi:hypothetical protein